MILFGQVYSSGRASASHRGFAIQINGNKQHLVPKFCYVENFLHKYAYYGCIFAFNLLYLQKYTFVHD